MSPHTAFPPLPHFDPLLSTIYRLALTDLDPLHAADLFGLLAAIYKTTTEAINLGRDLIKATVEPPHCISAPTSFRPPLSTIYRLALTDLDPAHAADIFGLLAPIYKTTTEVINLGRDLIMVTVEPPQSISASTSFRPPSQHHLSTRPDRSRPRTRCRPIWATGSDV